MCIKNYAGVLIIVTRTQSVIFKFSNFQVSLYAESEICSVRIPCLHSLGTLSKEGK